MKRNMTKSEFMVIISIKCVGFSLSNLFKKSVSHTCIPSADIQNYVRILHNAHDLCLAIFSSQCLFGVDSHNVMWYWHKNCGILSEDANLGLNNILYRHTVNTLFGLYVCTGALCTDGKNIPKLQYKAYWKKKCMCTV